MSRFQSVKVDGKRSRPVAVVLGVPQGSVLGSLLFCYTQMIFPVCRDLNKSVIGVTHAACRMRVNPNETKSLVISRSRTVVPQLAYLVLY